MKHTLYVTVKIQVESDLEIDEIKDEFSSETYYNFEKTDNIQILDTELLKVEDYLNAVL